MTHPIISSNGVLRWTLVAFALPNEEEIKDEL